MATDTKGLRFDQITSELAGGDMCAHCKTLLELIEMPLEGVGKYAVIPMKWCKRCDKYYMYEDDNE